MNMNTQTMKYRFLFLLMILVANVNAQSFHQQQLDYYNSLGHADAQWYEQHTSYTPKPQEKAAGCNLNKTVYGWHPYWVGSVYNNYDWSLLSHFSFFSYEVDAATGNATTTHGWATSTAVDAALASGNTKVTLTATLFSSHSTFFASSTAQQTLITNLINLVQSRGAHGVNIDFEGLPSSQKTNFSNFMVNLANQMHAVIPGSEVSTVLYSVDWSNVFDFATMEPAVDQYIIMGYGYYYGGSSTAGPTDPLYQFGTSYNYTLSRSVTDYLKAGCPTNKLILGLPYYGYEWPTSSTTVPSSTTGSGSARTFKVVMDNTSGNYSAANHQYDNDSYSDIFVFNSGGTRQCFITLEGGFRKRLEHVNRTGIGGIGIWALGYDDGYTQMWNGINDFLTDCYADSCTSMIHDFGGPTKNYYNNEDYTFTLAPPGAVSINMNFTSFDVESNYDYLYIYDGPNTSSPQIAGSPFTGTTSPGSFSSSTGELTFRFTSDGATTAPGFVATYACVQDNTPPTTAVTAPNNWETTNFTSSFTDNDNMSVDYSFYQVSDYNSTEWRANNTFGFFNDEFNTGTVNSDWTTQVGTWSVVNNTLQQTDETQSNSNLSASLTQDNQHQYLYHWKGQINGTGTNRRAGIHFFCDDPTQTQRGNSYMVYWRDDQDKCQIYKSTANSITLETNDNVVVNPNTWYDFKILFDPTTGKIKAFLNDVLVSQWTDSSPLTAGNSISLRTGNAVGVYENFRVYKSRTNSEMVSIGTNNELRYQNPNPSTPAGKIRSIVIDGANNFSTIDSVMVNVDWTVPIDPTVADGISTDIDTFYVNTEITANWSGASDPNSGVASYEYAVGTTAGGTNIVNWTSNGSATNVTHTGLSLTYNTMYYVSVRTTDGAGLTSTGASSNGQYLKQPSQPPIASFTTSSTTVCAGDQIQLNNNSTNATSYSWTTSGGTLSGTTATNPTLTVSSSGSYTIQLAATGPGGTNNSSQTINVTVIQAPIAAATPNSTSFILPSATLTFTNSSSNATSYFWNFGDGNTSTASNPSNSYTSAGTYNVMLVASNGSCSNDTAYFTIVVNPPTTNPPVANFSYTSTTICTGETIQLQNSSTNATSYTWSTNNGTLSSTTVTNPYLIPTSSGNYSVTLTANGPGGTDVNTQTISITVLPTPAASATYTINGNSVYFTNTSTNATSYAWDFGDGNTSIDQSPWNTYSADSNYLVTLVASNGTCTDTIYYSIIINTTSIQEHDWNVNIYPNPFSDKITIDAGEAKLEEIKIYDLAGRIIYSGNVNHTSLFLVDLTGRELAFGTYILELNDDNNQSLRIKLLK